MKRYQIANKVKANNLKIAALKQANVELNHQHFMLSDKRQQYKEQEETFGRGKNKETFLIGRIYWKEYFCDESTNKKVLIERSHVVRKNGEWINGY